MRDPDSSQLTATGSLAYPKISSTYHGPVYPMRDETPLLYSAWQHELNRISGASIRLTGCLSWRTAAPIAHIDHNNSRDDSFLFHVPAPTISVDTSTATPTAASATTNTTTIPNDLEQDETDSITRTRLSLSRTHTSPTALASIGSFPNLNLHIFPHLYTTIGNVHQHHTPSGAARVSFSQSLHNSDRPGSAHAHFSPLHGHGHRHTGHSHLGSAYNSAFNSTTTSARTSLTRIDALAMENSDSDMGRPLGEEEIARREEERQRMEQEGREKSERETGAEVQEEARVESAPEVTSADAPAPLTESTTVLSSVPVVPATESQAQVQITMESKIPLTFLLITGARRSMSFDPETTVGRVKELIWGGWPEEFPASDKPPTPSYLRLLHLGKILQDEDTLTRLKFPSYTPSYSSPPSTSPADPAPSAPSSPTSATSPSSLPAPMPLTIIHLSIRPHGPGIPHLSEDGNGLPKKKGMSIRRRSLFSGVQVPPLSLAVFNSNNNGNNGGNGPTSPTSPSAGGGGGGEAQSPTQGQVGVIGTTGLEGGVVASAVVSSSAPAPPVEAGDEHGGRSREGGCCVIC
ncbi:hypothetical protein VKT23_010225 [Stygiomarasmius scandens]|uniref:Ubiquitin-like domain-containing protein n=1 Tax=Marasmiellus scandens TaxID=2682957 RepID=A0ABR1JI74_9AGAR